jgi:hypothetical protein
VAWAEERYSTVVESDSEEMDELETQWNEDLKKEHQ